MTSGAGPRRFASIARRRNGNKNGIVAGESLVSHTLSLSLRKRRCTLLAETRLDPLVCLFVRLYIHAVLSYRDAESVTRSVSPWKNVAETARDAWLACSHSL